MNKSVLKKNVIWNFIGGFTTAITSLFYTFILARFTNLDITGLFTIAFTLACNTVTLASFGGRTYQVTDAKKEISNISYIISRYFTIICTLIGLIIYLLIKNYDISKSLVILLVCIFKYIEELSDVYYGIIQKNNKLYKVGMFQFYKSIINVILFTILIYIYKDLTITFSILIIFNLFYFIFVERKSTYKIESWKFNINKLEIKKYLKNNIFICLLIFLTTYIVSLPKYSIDNLLNEKLLAIFGIIIMPATVMLLVSGFILNPLIVPISEEYKNNNIKEIKDIIYKIFKIILLIGLIGLIVCYFFGIPLLNLIYNLDLSNYKLSLMVIIVGSILYALTSIISSILILMRKIKIQVIGNIIVILTSLLFTNALVKNYLILGASIAYLLLISIRFIIYIYILNKNLAIKEENKTKRVLHLLASNSYSGAENVVCTIINNNTLYEMYYCSPNGPIKDTLENKNIKYIPIKSLSVFNVRKIIKKYNIDIIHAHDFKASTIAVLTGFKYVISHIHCYPDFVKSWNMYSAIYYLISKRLKKIIFVSKECFNNIIFKKSIINKSVVINNVVDKNNVIKLSNEFKTNKYDLVFLGRLIDLKNPLLVIEITKELYKIKKSIKTCIIGDGLLKEDCNKLIKEYSLEKNIDLVGFKSNPFPYIKNSRIAIMPSLSEGIAMSAIEFMILNKPVLNSGVGGLKEIFTKNFICNKKEDYINKINGMNDKKVYISYQKDISKLVNKYTDMNNYMKEINTIYGGINDSNTNTNI